MHFYIIISYQLINMLCDHFADVNKMIFYSFGRTILRPPAKWLYKTNPELLSDIFSIFASL